MTFEVTALSLDADWVIFAVNPTVHGVTRLIEPVVESGGVLDIPMGRTPHKP